MTFAWIKDVLGCPSGLRRAARDLERNLDLARRLARSTGRLVTLAAEPAPGRLLHPLAPGFSWGKPASVPLPPGTLDARWALAPRPLTVTPWGTATEAMWFLQRRGTVLCLHLTARGACRLLAFGPFTRTRKEA